MTRNPNVFLPPQEKFVHFLNKLQEADEILEKPLLVSSVTGELRNKQLFLETSDVEIVKNLKIHTTDY